MRDFFHNLGIKISKALPINKSGTDKKKKKKEEEETTTTTMSAAQTKRRAKTSKGTEPPPLRILCFGDSLTSGFPAGNPYAGRMAEKIEKAFPGRKVECEVEGAPGDRVTDGRYLNRMQMSWAVAEHKYDWTIVLGGTNDIGWDKPADQTLEGLKRVWDIPLSKGSKVLALTIPETRRKFPAVISKRNDINEAIKSHERKNFFHFDLSKAFPYHDMPPEDRGKYWDMDGLHLQAAGYDLMGEKIGEALVRILWLAEAQETDISSIVSDARQRKAIEDLIFEEEMGDPGLLSQGYIVVRRKDLD